MQRGAQSLAASNRPINRASISFSSRCTLFFLCCVTKGSPVVWIMQVQSNKLFLLLSVDCIIQALCTQRQTLKQSFFVYYWLSFLNELVLYFKPGKALTTPTHRVNFTCNSDVKMCEDNIWPEAIIGQNACPVSWCSNANINFVVASSTY